MDEIFSQIKSVGGYEHYARAIIPFLMEELKVTGISQVFMSVEKKTEFMMQLKLIVVSLPSKKTNLNKLIRLLEGHQGIEILSVIPPRLYQKQTEVNIMNLKITLADFVSIAAIFQTIKNILKNLYGQVRDFDEGLRDSDMRSLTDLTAEAAHRQSPADQGDLFQFRRDLPPGDPARDPGRDHEAGLRDHQGGQERRHGPRGRQVQEHPPSAARTNCSRPFSSFPMPGKRKS